MRKISQSTESNLRSKSLRSVIAGVGAVRRVWMAVVAVLLSVHAFAADRYTVGRFIYELNGTTCKLVGVDDPSTLVGKIKVPLHVEIQGAEYDCSLVSKMTFEDCDKVTALKFLSEKNVDLSFQLFIGCEALETIDLPETTQSLDWDVFKGCTSLKNVVIRSLYYIEPDYNYSYSPIKDSSFEDEVTLYVPADIYDKYCEEAEKSGTFWSYFNIKTLDNFVDNDDEYTFGMDEDDDSDSSYLLEFIVRNNRTTATLSTITPTDYAGKVVVPASCEINGKSYFVAEVDLRCFRECPNITEIEILADPEVTRYIIGERAFLGDVSLQKVTLPSSVTQFYDDTFSGCGNLRTVVLPAASMSTILEGDIDEAPEGVWYPNATLYVEGDIFDEYARSEDWLAVFGRILPLGHSENVTLSIDGRYIVELITDMVGRNVSLEGHKAIEFDEEQVKEDAEGLFELAADYINILQSGGMKFNITSGATPSAIRTLATDDHTFTLGGVSGTVSDLAAGDRLKVTVPSNEKIESGEGYTSQQVEGNTYLLTVTDPASARITASSGLGPSSSVESEIAPISLSLRGDVLVVDGLDPADALTIYDLAGRPVYTGRARRIKLAAGTYVLRAPSCTVKFRL